MEDQNMSLPNENIFRKIPSFIFRGTLWGIIGGGTVVLLFQVIPRLSFLISQGSFAPSKLHIFRTFVRHFSLDVVTLGIPIGFVFGISTGILAAVFGYHCPKLFSGLVLSWIGVITGFWLSGLGTRGFHSDFLLEVSFMSLAASGMAYQSTIQDIRKGVPKAASWAYSVLASFSWASLIFIMMYLYFKVWSYIINMPS